MIARVGKVPILPVVIYGTSHILPMNKTYYMFPHKAVIQIMKPIVVDHPMHPSQATTVAEEDQNLDDLRNSMRTVYKNLIDELEKQK